MYGRFSAYKNVHNTHIIIIVFIRNIFLCVLWYMYMVVYYIACFVHFVVNIFMLTILAYKRTQ